MDIDRLVLMYSIVDLVKVIKQLIYPIGLSLKSKSVRYNE